MLCFTINIGYPSSSGWSRGASVRVFYMGFSWVGSSKHIHKEGQLQTRSWNPLSLENAKARIMEFYAQFVIKIDWKIMVVFILFCLVLSHVSMVLWIMKIPMDLVVITTMAWIEPNARVRGGRETTDCDFQVLSLTCGPWNSDKQAYREALFCRGTGERPGAFPSLEELGWIQRSMKGPAPRQPGDLGSQGQQRNGLSPWQR